MRQYSKSVITFKELEKKISHYHEFGNEWGLYIDIEKNNSDMEVITKRSIIINEYGTPQYVYQVQQIKNFKKEFDKKPMMPMIREVKDYNNEIQKNKVCENENILGKKWTLNNLFTITSTISVVSFGAFFLYFNYWR